jgi:hypothetical protein
MKIEERASAILIREILDLYSSKPYSPSITRRVKILYERGCRTLSIRPTEVIYHWPHHTTELSLICWSDGAWSLNGSIQEYL